MKIKNMIKLGAAVLSLSLSLSPLALAISTDGVVETGNVKLNRSGNNEWRVGPEIGANAVPAADGAAALGVYSVLSSSYAVTVSSGGTVQLADEIALGVYTTTQLGTKAPRRVGTIVYNTSTALVCVSTGLAAGNYAAIGSTAVIAGAAVAGTRPCF